MEPQCHEVPAADRELHRSEDHAGSMARAPSTRPGGASLGGPITLAETSCGAASRAYPELQLNAPNCRRKLAERANVCSDPAGSMGARPD